MRRDYGERETAETEQQNIDVIMQALRQHEGFRKALTELVQKAKEKDFLEQSRFQRSAQGIYDLIRDMGMKEAEASSQVPGRIRKLASESLQHGLIDCAEMLCSVASRIEKKS